MDILKTAREIGLFETAVNLAKVGSSEDVVQKVGASMPLPDVDIEERIVQSAAWLAGFGKKKYMFLTPEIALIEEMGKKAGSNVEIIIAVPSDMDPEGKDRLKNNLPRGISVSVLEEPYFPPFFYPSNAMMVTCGYLGGGRAMVFPDTYRMVEHYGGFLGKKVFVPYTELDAASRYSGWMEAAQNRINAKWRIGS